MKEVYISRAGYERLHERYEEIDAKIADIHKKMGESIELDRDLNENSEYLSLRLEAMYNLPYKKRELAEKYRNVIIIEETEEYKNFDGETVIIGSEVTIIYGGEEETYIILGNDEGNCAKGILSCQAPLAEKILHKKAGDITELNGEEIKIISIRKV